MAEETRRDNRLNMQCTTKRKSCNVCKRNVGFFLFWQNFPPFSSLTSMTTNSTRSKSPRRSQKKQREFGDAMAKEGAVSHISTIILIMYGAIAGYSWVVSRITGLFFLVILFLFLLSFSLFTHLTVCDRIRLVHSTRFLLWLYGDFLSLASFGAPKLDADVQAPHAPPLKVVSVVSLLRRSWHRGAALRQQADSFFATQSAPLHKRQPGARRPALRNVCCVFICGVATGRCLLAVAGLCGWPRRHNGRGWLGAPFVVSRARLSFGALLLVPRIARTALPAPFGRNGGCTQADFA